MARLGFLRTRRGLWLARFGIAVSIVSGCYALSTSRLRADDAAVVDAIAQILEAGWPEPLKAVDAAREKYEAAKTAASRDARVPWALALVNIKHGKHGDAAKLVDEVLVLDKRHRDALQAKLWISMLLKRYPAALSQIDELSVLLAAGQASQSDEAKAVGQETARFLGGLFGFLEGPAVKAVKADQLADAKKAVSDRLTAEQREAFAAGQKAVAERFDELSAKREQASQDAEATKETQKKAQEEKAKEQGAALGKDKQEVQQQAAKLREQLEKYLADLETQRAQLESQSKQAEESLSRLLQRKTNLDSQIKALSAKKASGADQQLRKLREDYRACDTEYRTTGQFTKSVPARRSALLAQRDAAVQKYNAEAKRLGQQEFKLGQKEKALASGESGGKSSTDSGTHALSQKALAFTTYQPFPLEEAKKRLLDSLK